MFAACTPAERPPTPAPGAVDLTSEAPAVTAATLTAASIELTFNRSMAVTLPEGTVRIWKLRDHALGDLATAADVEIAKAMWRDERHLSVARPTAAGHYVLELDPAIRDRAGRALDGRTEGDSAGLLRPDDDGLAAPAAWRSLAWREGAPAMEWSSLPSRPAIVVTDVTGWHTATAGGARDEDPEQLWQRGAPRVGRRSPAANESSLRIAFGSDAGVHWSLVPASALETAVQLVDETGAALRTKIELSRQPGVDFGTGEKPRVVSATGRTVTVDRGPSTAWTTLRGPEDPVWVLFGEKLPPRGVLAKVDNWSRPVFTFSADEVTVVGTIAGATATTDRRWPVGLLDGGYSLWTSDDVEYPIAAATGPVIYLTASTDVATPCAPCRVRLERLEERVAPETALTLVSNVWYLHPVGGWPAGRPLKLIINAGQRIRSMMGQPMFDEERDGNEVELPAVADNEFILQLSLRPHREIEPTVSRLNDGSLYPTVFAGLGWTCMSGDPSDPVCVREVLDSHCGTTLPGTLSFSLYTADGSSNAPRGQADLIDVARLEPGHVVVFDADSGRALDRVVETRTVLHQTAVGTFPTSLVEVHLRESDGGRCPDGSASLRGLRDGDRLVIDHRLRPVVPTDPRTLDGNGDGVASASPADDWVGIWHAAEGRFVPLDRRPRR